MATICPRNVPFGAFDLMITNEKHNRGCEEQAVETARRHAPVKAIAWWEPRWAVISRLLKDLHRWVGFALWLRIVTLSGIAFIGIWLLARRGVPNLQFNWLQAFAISLAGAVALFAYSFLVCVLIPPRIKVRPWCVFIRQGQWWKFYTSKQIVLVHLVLHQSGRISMWVVTQSDRRHFGVSRKVDLVALAGLLGEKLVVHDRLRRMRMRAATGRETAEAEVG